MDPASPRWRDLAHVIGSAGLFTTTLGMSLPVLPRYVADVLDGPAYLSGLVVSVFAVASVLARPVVGRIGDGHGRRTLVVGGSAITAVALAGHLVADGLLSLIPLRLVVGVGLAAMMVGTLTLAQDLVPPSRSGQAAGYVMVSTQVGLAAGPLLGDMLLGWGSYDLVWLVGTAFCVLCALLAARVPADAPRAPVLGRIRFAHPPALRPGLVFLCGMVGYTGYLAFVPLFARTLGAAPAPLLFLVSGTAGLVRLVGARLPDRVGPVRTTLASMTLTALSLGGMALRPSALVLHLLTVGLAVGASLLAPALIVVASRRTPPHERARAIATVTMFWDVGFVVGPALLGLVVDRAGYSAMFATAAGVALLGVLLCRAWLSDQEEALES